MRNADVNPNFVAEDEHSSERSDVKVDVGVSKET